MTFLLGIPSGKHLNNDKHVATKFKRKKGPAPAMPVMRRSVTPLPIADIKQELEVCCKMLLESQN